MAARLADPTGNVEVEVVDPNRNTNPAAHSEDGTQADGVHYSRGRYFHRDIYDIRRCNILLLNWWGDPGRQSVGTWTELGYAYAQQHLILVVDPKGEISHHPFVNRMASDVYASLEEACEYIKWYCSP